MSKLQQVTVSGAHNYYVSEWNFPTRAMWLENVALCLRLTTMETAPSLTRRPETLYESH
jgi:hypothetical protein